MDYVNNPYQPKIVIQSTSSTSNAPPANTEQNDTVSGYAAKYLPVTVEKKFLSKTTVDIPGFTKDQKEQMKALASIASLHSYTPNSVVQMTQHSAHQVLLHESGAGLALHETPLSLVFVPSLESVVAPDKLNGIDASAISKDDISAGIWASSVHFGIALGKDGIGYTRYLDGGLYRFDVNKDVQWQPCELPLSGSIDWGHPIVAPSGDVYVPKGKSELVRLGSTTQYDKSDAKLKDITSEVIEKNKNVDRGVGPLKVDDATKRKINALMQECEELIHGDSFDLSSIEKNTTPIAFAVGKHNEILALMPANGKAGEHQLVLITNDDKKTSFKYDVKLPKDLKPIEPSLSFNNFAALSQRRMALVCTSGDILEISLMSATMKTVKTVTTRWIVEKDEGKEVLQPSRKKMEHHSVTRNSNVDVIQKERLQAHTLLGFKHIADPRSGESVTHVFYRNNSGQLVSRFWDGDAKAWKPGVAAYGATSFVNQRGIRHIDIPTQHACAIDKHGTELGWLDKVDSTQPALEAGQLCVRGQGGQWEPTPVKNVCALKMPPLGEFHPHVLVKPEGQPANIACLKPLGTSNQIPLAHASNMTLADGANIEMIRVPTTHEPVQFAIGMQQVLYYTDKENQVFRHDRLEPLVKGVAPSDIRLAALPPEAGKILHMACDCYGDLHVLAQSDTGKTALHRYDREAGAWTKLTDNREAGELCSLDNDRLGQLVVGMRTGDEGPVYLYDCFRMPKAAPVDIDAGNSKGKTIDSTVADTAGDPEGSADSGTVDTTDTVTAGRHCEVGFVQRIIAQDENVDVTTPTKKSVLGKTVDSLKDSIFVTVPAAVIKQTKDTVVHGVQWTPKVWKIPAQLYGSFTHNFKGHKELEHVYKRVRNVAAEFEGAVKTDLSSLHASLEAVALTDPELAADMQDFLFALGNDMREMAERIHHGGASAAMQAGETKPQMDDTLKVGSSTFIETPSKTFNFKKAAPEKDFVADVLTFWTGLPKAPINQSAASTTLTVPGTSSAVQPPAQKAHPQSGALDDALVAIGKLQQIGKHTSANKVIYPSSAEKKTKQYNADDPHSLLTARMALVVNVVNELADLAAKTASKETPPDEAAEQLASTKNKYEKEEITRYTNLEFRRFRQLEDCQSSLKRLREELCTPEGKIFKQVTELLGENIDNPQQLKHALTRFYLNTSEGDITVIETQNDWGIDAFGWVGTVISAVRGMDELVSVEGGTGVRHGLVSRTLDDSISFCLLRDRKTDGMLELGLGIGFLQYAKVGSSVIVGGQVNRTGGVTVSIRREDVARFFDRLLDVDCTAADLLELGEEHEQITSHGAEKSANWNNFLRSGFTPGLDFSEDWGAASLSRAGGELSLKVKSGTQDGTHESAKGTKITSETTSGMSAETAHGLPMMNMLNTTGEDLFFLSTGNLNFYGEPKSLYDLSTGIKYTYDDEATPPALDAKRWKDLLAMGRLVFAKDDHALAELDKLKNLAGSPEEVPAALNSLLERAQEKDVKKKGKAVDKGKVEGEAANAEDSTAEGSNAAAANKTEDAEWKSVGHIARQQWLFAVEEAKLLHELSLRHEPCVGKTSMEAAGTKTRDQPFEKDIKAYLARYDNALLADIVSDSSVRYVFELRPEARLSYLSTVLKRVIDKSTLTPEALKAKLEEPKKAEATFLRDPANYRIATIALRETIKHTDGSKWAPIVFKIGISFSASAETDVGSIRLFYDDKGDIYTHATSSGLIERHRYFQLAAKGLANDYETALRRLPNVEADIIQSEEKLRLRSTSNVSTKSVTSTHSQTSLGKFVGDTVVMVGKGGNSSISADSRKIMESSVHVITPTTSETGITDKKSEIVKEKRSDTDKDKIDDKSNKGKNVVFDDTKVDMDKLNRARDEWKDLEKNVDSVVSTKYEKDTTSRADEEDETGSLKIELARGDPVKNGNLDINDTNVILDDVSAKYLDAGLTAPINSTGPTSKVKTTKLKLKNITKVFNSGINSLKKKSATTTPPGTEEAAAPKTKKGNKFKKLFRKNK